MAADEAARSRYGHLPPTQGVHRPVVRRHRRQTIARDGSRLLRTSQKEVVGVGVAAKAGSSDEPRLEREQQVEQCQVLETGPLLSQLDYSRTAGTNRAGAFDRERRVE